RICDLRPIRRPDRGSIVSGLNSQPSLIAAVGVHYKNFGELAVDVVPRKCDLCAVRRPDRVALKVLITERQLLSITAVRVHRVDVRLRVALTANDCNTTVGDRS